MEKNGQDTPRKETSEKMGLVKRDVGEVEEEVGRARLAGERE